MGVGGTTVEAVEVEVDVAIRVGEVGGIGKNPFADPTASPLSCSARTRSAMEPPTLLTGTDSLGKWVVNRRSGRGVEKDTNAAVCFSIDFSFSSKVLVLVARSLQSPCMFVSNHGP